MESLPAILSHTFDAVICFDGEQRIVTWNPAAERLFGVPAENAVGRALEELHDGQRFDGIVALVRSAAGGEKIQNVQLNFTNSTLEINAAQLSNEKLVVLVARATGTRASEGERGSSANDTFFAALAHQLRMPLTPVLMTAAALRADERLPADAREQLAMIESNIGLEGRLINELLNPSAAADSTVDVARAASAVPAEQPTRDEHLPLRLLLVEDHESTLQVLSRLLTRAGHQVVTAGTLTGALSAASRGSFDLVISDLGLPDGTGHELMEILRARHGLRGIALSGYGMQDDIMRARRAGFATHLTKPVDFTQLQRALREAVQGAPA